jgi:hypothetical protein
MAAKAASIARNARKCVFKITGPLLEASREYAVVIMGRVFRTA